MKGKCRQGSCRRSAQERQSDLDLAKAQSELAVMAAQIAALRKYRQKM